MKWIHVLNAAKIAEQVMTELNITVKDISAKQFEDAIRIALTTGKTLKEVLKPQH